MKRLWILLLLAAVCGVSGCSTTEPTQDNDAEVTTIPWNKPEPWEGRGPLGGFAPGGQ